MTLDEFLQVLPTVARDDIVVAGDLRALGATGEDIRRFRDAGHLLRQMTGIYTTPGAPTGDLLLARVASAHAGPGALVTGTLGARMLGWRWVPATGKAQVLVPAERRRSQTEAWVLVRRCSWHNTLTPVEMDGVLLAPNAQIAVDAGRETNDLRDVRGVVLGALLDNRCTVEEVRSVLGRSAIGGTALVRRACTDAEPGATSPPEAEAADLLLGRGVPFYVNCEIYLDGKLIGVADIWLVGEGVGGEIDSREFHEEEDLLNATFQGDKRFREATLSLEHFTPARMRADAEGFVQTLFTTAARRRAQGITEPAGLTIKPRGPLLC